MMEKGLHEFLEHLLRKRYKKVTVDDYGRTLRTFYRFVNENYPDVKEVTDITREMVLSYEKYLTTKKDAFGNKILSRGRRRKHLSSLKAFFIWLQKEERIYRNPAVNIAIPKYRRPALKGVLSIEEMDRILKKCSGHSITGLRDRAILELLYSAGIRADELCSIQVEDVDLEEKVLYVRKGKMDSCRMVPFGDAARYWVSRYLERARPLVPKRDDELLFVSSRGRKMNPDILCRIIKKWAKVAGIEKNVTTHTFRHSCATHMLKGKADIRYVQQQLGHKDISTTEKYLRIEITDLKEVHERTHPREQDDW